MDFAERELFQKALLEAMVNKYDKEMADCTEDARCSNEHFEKVSKIIGVNVSKTREYKKMSKRTVVALILAAALLLSSCIAVYAYRNEIRGFVEKIYEKYIAVSFEDGDNSQDNTGEISKVYTLSYLPDGYIVTNEKITPLSIFYEFKNNDSLVMTFTQQNLRSAQFWLDVEHGESVVIATEGLDLYCRVIDNSYHYIWNDGEYAMLLTSDVEFSQDVLLQIIEGVIVKE